MTVMKRRVAALERGSFGDMYPGWLRAWLGYPLTDAEQARADADLAKFADLSVDPKQVSPEMVAWLAR